MKKTMICFDSEQIDFINKYREYGYKSKSSLVRFAISELIKSVKKEELIKSAKLYAEIYRNDKELQELTNSAF